MRRCPVRDTIMQMYDQELLELHFGEQHNDKDYGFKECKAMDSRAMGSVASWYHRGGTSVESSIPCSDGGIALVVKGVEEVKNAEVNSKY
ncbi:hypothetical protein BHE74_00055805 [Ensete ventricosum]|uniref:Uncharacterized protein n=1 Tax=Ensete ventricosum TaxID=4639 RepID=A0A445MK03_ENSVE|nr:hypothetical protein BHE74_00055805 [Ensete ventricosum]RZR74556.1 hypothetical protein BHM03_00038416 [Ensete ventricosum]